MESRRARLDRFICGHLNIKRSDVRLLLAQGRIQVDGHDASACNQQVHQFSHIELDGKSLQNCQPVYLMLNKPQGVVSATKDSHHPTAIDLLDHPLRDQLHIVGRLDFNSTGLLLLTNDGHWSRRLSSPQQKIDKRYYVRVENKICAECIVAFADGIHFPFEGITTQAAGLRLIDDYHAEVSLREGRYHQIKRMFGRFDNKVLSIHRFAVGPLVLDENLQAGECRALTDEELQALQGC
ncbi:MAG: pseudouridine synthase [Spongiibacteraceae bacterium]